MSAAVAHSKCTDTLSARAAWGGGGSRRSEVAVVHERGPEAAGEWEEAAGEGEAAGRLHGGERAVRLAGKPVELEEEKAVDRARLEPPPEEGGPVHHADIVVRRKHHVTPPLAHHAPLGALDKRESAAWRSRLLLPLLLRRNHALQLEECACVDTLRCATGGGHQLLRVRRVLAEIPAPIRGHLHHVSAARVPREPKRARSRPRARYDASRALLHLHHRTMFGVGGRVGRRRRPVLNRLEPLKAVCALERVQPQPVAGVVSDEVRAWRNSAGRIRESHSHARSRGEGGYWVCVRCLFSAPEAARRSSKREKNCLVPMMDMPFL